jgi:hypothetical protein
VLGFVHGRKQQVEALLVRANAVFTKHNQLDLDFLPALKDLLAAAAEHYRSQNRSAEENELLSLAAQVVAAEQGMNPLNGERVTTHRRGLRRAIGLKALQDCAALLRGDAAALARRISDGEGQLRPIILLSLQQGLLPTDFRHEDEAALDTLWTRVLQDASTTLAARQLAMQLGPHDIRLLLRDLLAAAASPPPALAIG